MSDKRLDEQTVDRRQFLKITGAMAGLAGLGLPNINLDAVEAATFRASKGRIAFGQPDRSASVYPVLLNGAKAEAQRRGYQLLESFANSQADKQVAEINTWIGEHINGMTILPLDEKAMSALIKKAHQNHVVFVSYSDRLPGVDGYTVFDSIQGGTLVGKWVGHWINQNLGGKAQVAALTAEFHQTGRQRIHNGIAGMQSVAPGAKVVAKTEAVLAADALKATSAILQAHPDVNVILCIADDGCLGAEQAAREAGKDPKKMCIVGWDGSKPVMQKIITGKSAIKATGALDLTAIGASAVWVPANIIEKRGPRFYNSKYLLINPSTKAVAQRLISAYP